MSSGSECNHQLLWEVYESSYTYPVLPWLAAISVVLRVQSVRVASVSRRADDARRLGKDTLAVPKQYLI